jgi:hypothetical protein
VRVPFLYFLELSEVPCIIDRRPLTKRMRCDLLHIRSALRMEYLYNIRSLNNRNQDTQLNKDIS